MDTPVDVVLVTGSDMPRWETETDLLRSAVAARGLRVAVQAWREPYDWSAARLVLVRTPWDYTRHREAFLDWADGVAAVTTLWNPPAVLRWNAHKGYLLDLAAGRAPVVATRLVPAGASAPQRAEALAGFGEVVVKPAVGAGSRGAARGPASSGAVTAALDGLVAAGDALVQPFLPAVAAGEVSLVHLGGVYSHAVRKVPAAGDYRVQREYGGTEKPHSPTPSERAAADAALAAGPGPLAYARVDLVDGGAGPVVMELELIEPELFLAAAPGAADRFAAYLAGLVAPLRR